MPIQRGKNKSVVADLTLDHIDDPTHKLNAIDFVEGPGGTGIILRPVQRVILKALCAVPFDYKPYWADTIKQPDGTPWGMVPMWNTFRDQLIRTVTEEEYLHICYEEGRCNIDDWRDIPARGFNEGVIFCGRRGGKSELVAAIAAYRLYLLLNIYSPQQHFGMADGSQIDFTFLAQDETGAGRLFKKLSAAVNRAQWFNGYLKDNNSKSLTFRSRADQDRKDAKPSVVVWSLPCTTNAVRGPSSVFLALDEFAHFRSEKGSTSEDMYVAATPAAGDFHHYETVDAEDENGNPVLDENGKRVTQKVQYQDSMILSISSPLKKVGMMYDLYKMALQDGVNDDNPTFVLACSSAEMNPALKPGFLRDKHRKNPLTFKAEYGGQFLESSESYVREVDVRACIDPGRKNLTRFSLEQLGRQYFWGLDLGGINVTDPNSTASDATALAIGHLEFRQRPEVQGVNHGIVLVYDYIDRMICGEEFIGPGVKPDPEGKKKYVDFQVLPLGDVLVWLNYMNKQLPCYQGVCDQHAGRQLIALLEQNDIRGMELVNLTPAINSEMAYALRGFINDKTAFFPDIQKYVDEIKMVETDVISKYRIRVHAPIEKGAHDDMVDATQLVALLAQKWLIEQGNLRLDPTGRSLVVQQQAARGAGRLISTEGVSMAELRLRERMQRMGGGVPGMGTPGIPGAGRRSDPRWVRKMGGKRMR